jgi:4-methylaminobutanoate oxidase (formaldehyde-forming)
VGAAGGGDGGSESPDHAARPSAPATKPIPGHELPRETPCLRDPENLVYLREEVGGFLIGGFEREPVAWSVDGVPWDFTQRLLPSDWELFDEIMEGAIRRVPILGQAEMAHLTNGPEGITPDSRPLLGPVPGVPGFWVAAGLSHTGFGAGAATATSSPSGWWRASRPTTSAR